jgi:hypothetical protein
MTPHHACLWRLPRVLSFHAVSSQRLALSTHYPHLPMTRIRGVLSPRYLYASTLITKYLFGPCINLHPQQHLTRLCESATLCTCFHIVQGGSNMTGTNCDLFTHKSSRSYLNHLVHRRLNFERITLQDNAGIIRTRARTHTHVTTDSF